MTFEIVDAKSYHVGRMVRSMRIEHAAAVLRLGINAHRELNSVFQQSSVRRAWLIDGKLAAIGGVTGMLASRTGHLWLVISQHATKFPMELIKSARRELGLIMETRNEVTTAIFNGDEASLRFARFFGFRQTSLVRDGMIRMALHRDAPITDARPADHPPFLIFALPRSRTAWLSQFLSYGESWCVHDAMLEVEGLSGLRRLLDRPNTGICETGLTAAWPALKRLYPHAQFVVINRAVDQVRCSLAKHGWQFEPGHLEWLDSQLDALSALPGTLTVGFDQLGTEEGCRAVFETCLHQPFDRAWWQHWDGQIVQIDMDARLRRITQRDEGMRRLVADCQALMGPVTFQIERWDDFARDGKDLFIEHHLEVGELDGLPYDPNFARAEALDRLGNVLIVTARAGRQMVGYIVFLIDHHPESREVLQGIQNTFFVTRGFRGIGPRLHAEAVNALKARGVTMLSMSAGVRGSGPKLASLYRRLGATEERRVFSLRIA